MATIATSGEPSTPEPCAHLEAQRATAHASFDRAEAALLSLSGAQGTAFIEQVAEQRARLNAYFSALQAVCDPTSAADTVPAAHGHVDG